MAAADYFDTVQKIYIAFYSRPADPVGQTYWADVLNGNGGNIAGMIDSFATSAEATALYEGLGTNAKINAIYNALFGRDGDVAGITFYANEIAAGRMTIGGVGINILFGAQAGVDLDAVNAKVDYCASFTAAIDTADELVGYEGTTAAETARTQLATVTDAATLTTATADIDATLTTIVTEHDTGATTTTNLTTSADEFTGGTGNDTYVAAVGRLTTDDQINGGAGHDVLEASLNASAAPVISNVEQLNISFRNATAGLDLSDISGYTAIQVDGNTSGRLSNLGDAAKITLQAYDDTLTVALDAAAASTANSITITVAGDSSGAFNLAAGGTNDIETVNLVVNNQATAWRNTAGLEFGSAAALNISGSGNVTIVGSGLASTAAASVRTINASALQGNLTLTLDSANLAFQTGLNFVGGAGNDSINFKSTITSSDSIDGGEGTDSMTVLLDSTNTVRPNIAGIETLSVEFDSAGTFDGRSAAGITTLNVDADGADGTFTRLLGVTTLNFRSANDNTDDLSVTYQTGADLDVTVNLGAASTAFDGMSAGDLTMAGNNGAVTLATVNSGNHNLASATFANATALTVNATAAAGPLNLNFLNVATAQSVTFNLNAGVDMTSATLSVATTLSVNATGTAAAFSADTITGNKLQSLTFVANGVGISEIEATTINLAASALDTITVSSNSTADVNFGVYVAGTAAAMTFDVNASVGSGSLMSAQFTLAETLASAAGAGNIAFTLGGEGSYALSVNALTASEFFGTVTVDATGMTSTGGQLCAFFTAFAVASATIEANLGAGSDNFLAGSGNDTIDGGDGGDTITGGGGADSLMGGAGADSLLGGAGND